MAEFLSAEAATAHIAEVIPLGRARPREVTAQELDQISSEVVARTEAAEVPSHLLDAPGLVGYISRWITKTALYPQPLLSLGAALVLVGTAAGRKYAGPTRSGTHLYVLGLAGTGAGKNHPAKQAKRLLRSCNMEEVVGPGQFMSEPAVYQYVSKQPQMVCFMDEFGSYLQRINNPKGSSGYERAISGVLRSLWGASFDTVNPPAWAASSGTVLKPIHSPAVSIYGMSVHEEFYQALQSADIANGFLNRFLILSTQGKPEEVDPSLDEDVVPPQLIDWLQRIGASTSPPGKRLSLNGSWSAEVRVGWACDEARLIYRNFQPAVTGKPDEAKLLSRVREMAVRLSTIRAIGASKTDEAAVNVDDITWGCDLALWSATRMIEDVANYMVESDHQARAKEVLRFVREAPGGRLSQSDLYRRVKNRFQGNVLRQILEDLASAEQIEVVRVRVGDAKRPTDFILYRGE